MSYDQQSQWNQPPDSSSWSQLQPQQAQQPQTQYNPSQWQQAQPQYDPSQWQQQQYNPQYSQPPYGPNQYNVPAYAQVQPQADSSGNFLMRWIMMRLAMRVIILVAIFMLCGGCALVALLSSLANH